MNKKKILLVGSANMDFSMNVYRVPEAGETVLDDGGVAYTPGGKGANSAIAVHKLGGECVFAAKLGADAHGQKLFNYYKEIGINTSYIKVDHDRPTGLSVVIREADGQNRIVVYPGANSNITNEGILEAFECQPDAVYLGFEIPFSAALSAAKIAAAVDAGILGCDMYWEHQQFYGGDGIVTKGVDKTVINVGILAREGMRETDKTILQIMLSDGE